MPCRRLDVVSLSDPKVKEALKGFEKLRIDTGEQPAVAETFDPTTLRLSQSQKETKIWMTSALNS